MLINSCSLFPAGIISVIERWNMGCTNFSEMLEVKATQTSWCVDVKEWHTATECSRDQNNGSTWTATRLCYPFLLANSFSRWSEQSFFQPRLSVCTSSSPAEFSLSDIFFTFSLEKWRGTGRLYNCFAMRCQPGQKFGRETWVCFQKGPTEQYLVSSLYIHCTVTKYCGISRKFMIF